MLIVYFIAIIVIVHFLVQLNREPKITQFLQNKHKSYITLITDKNITKFKIPMRIADPIMHILQSHPNFIDNPQYFMLFNRVLHQQLSNFPIIAILGQYIMIIVILEMCDKLTDIGMS